MHSHSCPQVTRRIALQPFRDMGIVGVRVGLRRGRRLGLRLKLGLRLEGGVGSGITTLVTKARRPYRPAQCIIASTIVCPRRPLLYIYI